MSTASNDQYYPGLEGVIANETAISNVEGKQGDGGLEYRGYQIEDLAAGVSYLEAAFLLLHGELPTKSQLDAFASRIKASSELPAPLMSLLGQIPSGNHPMDVLRTSVSVMAHFDPEVNIAPTDHAANVRKAERMLAQMPTAVAARERISKGLEPLAPRDDLDFSANFLYMVHGDVPTEASRKAFDLSLVLYAAGESVLDRVAARRAFAGVGPGAGGMLGVLAVRFGLGRAGGHGDGSGLGIFGRGRFARLPYIFIWKSGFRTHYSPKSGNIS